MGLNFPCGTCQNFEEEHRMCLATVLLKAVISSGRYFLRHLILCFNNSTTAGGVRLTLSTLQYPINHLMGVP
jgi:hypothetical protein